MDKRRRLQQKILLTLDAADRIAAVAARLFAEKGYDGVAIREISETAGVNTAMVYYYFESKEKLFRRIIEQFISDKLVSARKKLLPPHRVSELKVRLEGFIRETIEAMMLQPDVVCIMLHEEERSAHVIEKTILKNRTALIGFLIQAKKCGLLARDVDPSFVAGSLTAQIVHASGKTRMGKSLFGYSPQEEKYREQWIHQILRVFLCGVLLKEINIRSIKMKVRSE